MPRVKESLKMTALSWKLIVVFFQKDLRLYSLILKIRKQNSLQDKWHIHAIFILMPICSDYKSKNTRLHENI